MNIENRKISIWGDSILKGVVLDECSGRYKVLENNCVSRFARITGAGIANHASFGMTTGKAALRIKNSLERNPLSAADIVLVEFGGNDCDFRWNEISVDPDGEHLPMTPISRFRAALQSIIDLFSPYGIQPVLMALPPLEPQKYFNWISRGLNAENILRWLGDVNKIYRWQEAYSDIVARAAAENNLRLIDVRKPFLVGSGYGSKFCADGIHPNESGHDTILEAFLEYVKSA